jgi:hypothetical protein
MMMSILREENRLACTFNDETGCALEENREDGPARILKRDPGAKK